MAINLIDSALSNLEVALENLESRYDEGESWNTDDAVLVISIEAAICSLRGRSVILAALLNLEVALENMESRYDEGESWNTEDAMLVVCIETARRALDEHLFPSEPRPKPTSMRMVGGLWLFVMVLALAWWAWCPVIPMW